jgi:hypothetical protein
MKERGQGRPEGAPKEEDRAPQKEQGRRHKESAERQPLPRVWDILERHVRLNTKDVEDHPRGKEHDRQQHEVNWLIYDLKTKKGTNREKLIIELFNSITIQPGEYGPTDRDLSLEEFQQFRSRGEALCEKEIAEEIRKQGEEKQRKIEEARKRGKILTLDLPSLAHYTPHLPYLPPRDIDNSDIDDH